MLNDFDLIEENERVEDGKCRIIENAREDNVLEIV
jgi:hypothetical protein